MVILLGGGRVEFYDRGGGLLRTICLRRPVAALSKAA